MPLLRFWCSSKDEYILNCHNRSSWHFYHLESFISMKRDSLLMYQEKQYSATDFMLSLT